MQSETVWVIFHDQTMGKLGKMSKRNEECTELGKLSDDDNPGCVMGTMFQYEQLHMVSNHQTLQ